MPKKWVSKNKTTIIILVLSIFLIAAVAADMKPFAEKPYESTSFAMGSALTVRLYGSDERTAELICEEVRTLENRISKNIPSSALSKLNETGGSDDAELCDFVLRMKNLGDKTDGAFDISLGALSELWDIGGENARIPTDAEISETLKNCGSGKIKSGADGVTIPYGMKLDPGAVGKGMACDAAYAVLCKTECTGAVVSSGGSVLLYGENPEGGAWTVGVRDPDGKEQDIICKLRIDEGFVSTSGNYEKYFISGGKRYCHILSPFDGFPADSGLKSVTVKADSGEVSDALSTACFLLGYEKSLPVLERFGAQAVFITDKNEIIPTAGIASSVEKV